MKNFLVECTDPHGKEKTMRFDYEENCTIAECRADLESDGYKVHKVVAARNHHVCLHCHSIADGTDKDVLCKMCQFNYGHTLFSQM